MIKRTRCFWVYPERGNKYWKFRVFITPGERAFANRARGTTIEGQTENVGAFCASFEVRSFKKGGPKSGTPTGDLGNMVFKADELYPEYIAHECSHAAHSYCRRKRKTHYNVPTRAHVVNDDEETFCYAQGWMTQQIISWAIANGFEWEGK